MILRSGILRSSGPRAPVPRFRQPSAPLDEYYRDSVIGGPGAFAMDCADYADFADAIRRKLIWSVVVFAALLAFMAPSLPSYGQGVISAVYREVTIALMFGIPLMA